MKEHQVHLYLSKPIIRSWEKNYNNKHRIGLGYEKEITVHIHDYSKLVQFVSVGFLDEYLKEKDCNVQQVDVEVDDACIEEIINKCQHWHRVVHMDTKFFYLHPRLHCGKTNHR